MGQVLKKDIVRNLQHSAGNISIGAGSVVTIGGQQYTLPSSISVALPSLSYVQRYFVYAVISGGNPALVISQNVNSVGPAGFAGWKLVGAFYSNGQSPVGFGSFVTIEGVPETQLFPYIPTGSWVSNVTYSGFVKVIGDQMQLIMKIDVSSGPDVTQLVMNMIAGYSMDSSKLTASADDVARFPSDGYILDSGNTIYKARAVYQNANQFRTKYETSNSPGSGVGIIAVIDASNPMVFATGDEVFFEVIVPVVGLSNVPLKDL